MLCHLWGILCKYKFCWEIVSTNTDTCSRLGLTLTEFNCNFNFFSERWFLTKHFTCNTAVWLIQSCSMSFTILWPFLSFKMPFIMLENCDPWPLFKQFMTFFKQLWTTLKTLWTTLTNNIMNDIGDSHYMRKTDEAALLKILSAFFTI